MLYHSTFPSSSYRKAPAWRAGNHQTRSRRCLVLLMVIHLAPIRTLISSLLSNGLRLHTWAALRYSHLLASSNRDAVLLEPIHLTPFLGLVSSLPHPAAVLRSHPRTDYSARAALGATL